MPDDILNSMRALREDMRRRLLQSPEYRALEALDSAIDEIAVILMEKPTHEARAPETPVREPHAPPLASEIQIAQATASARETAAPAEAAPTPASRHNAIAAAFAESLAAKLDPRNTARPAAAYQPARRTQFE
jgi:hypothetical protein